jgi:hypothetical protein
MATWPSSDRTPPSSRRSPDSQALAHQTEFAESHQLGKLRVDLLDRKQRITAQRLLDAGELGEVGNRFEAELGPRAFEFLLCRDRG